MTFTSFTVTGAPEMRSAPITLVPPIFAHSVRIVRTGTEVASTDTRPSLKVSFNGCCARAGAAIRDASATESSVRRM